MTQNKPNTISTILISLLFILLTIAGIISYKSIDFDILRKLEAQPISLPPKPSQPPSQTP
ncbi:hypothetical protein KKC08_05035 [Patescibacteria group bacterium]|nr:hypothetical protein [Patescibacteria group bacterium]MCG2702339.1 hypothetical protein [Candidatus Parcubacteria bacterium]MBU4264971.1 hypothetical protein [Patescibacteria group bacterium]MBU4389808.1 hypothetical protein [Patescibacteria group bacterium]MBU4397502.1 hypothetical protein [Patescibacteria group bacterium]